MNNKIRRSLLKGLAVTVPAIWETPFIRCTVLPAHATTTIFLELMFSGISNPDGFLGPASTSDNNLQFSSPTLSSLSMNGESNSTPSTLQATITSPPAIDMLSIDVSGNTTLTAFPPFGTPGTNSNIDLSGTITIESTITGSIPPVVIPFTGTFSPADTFALPTDFGVVNFTGSATVDIGAAVPNATEMSLLVTTTASTNTDAGTTSAQLILTSLNISVSTT